jgi:hypothetical protein
LNTTLHVAWWDRAGVARGDSGMPQLNLNIR